MERQYKKQQAFIEHEEDFIKRNIAGQRTREAQGRRKLLARLERVERPQTHERAIKIRFTPDIRGGDDILQSRNLGKRYGDNNVLENLNFDFYRQDVVGIIGPNGTGKTTLFRMILGEEHPTTGKLKIGHNLHFGYYDQELAGLNRNNTVIDEIWELLPTKTQGEIRNFLGRFLFSEDEVFKGIGALSGGEQSRVMLAKLLLKNANVLLLDELTNHLDIPSREAVEDALAEYPATIFMISHDRYFINKLATKLLIFGNGTAELFLGTYAEYEAHLRHKKQTAVQPKAEVKRAKSIEKPQKQKRQHGERLRVAQSSKRSKKRKRKIKHAN